MRTFGFLLCLLALVLVASCRPSSTPTPAPSRSPKAASEWYISPFGSDKNNGKSAQKAFLTLSKALDSARKGDIIHAANGLYNGDKNTNLELGNVQLIGQSTSGTIFQGPPDSEDKYIFSIPDSATSTISNLTLQGLTPLSSGAAFAPGGDDDEDVIAGVYLDLLAEAEILNVSFTNLDYAVLLYEEAARLNMEACYTDHTVSYAVSSKEGLLVSAWEEITFSGCTFNSDVLLKTSDRTPVSEFSELSFTNCLFSDAHLEINTRAPKLASIDSCQFVNSTAISNGGAIEAELDMELMVTNCTFSSCTAPNGIGGAIHFTNSGDEGMLLVEYSTFTDCSATNGGALFIDDGGLHVDNSEFTANTATFGSGGAIGTSQPSDNTNNAIVSSVFTDNSAREEGGAIFFERTLSSSVIKFSTFSGNSAGSNGGSILLNTKNSVDVKNVTIEASSANQGGAISIGSSVSVTIFGTQLKGNQALDGDGGGVFADSSSEVAISSTAFVENTASLNGGGFAIVDGLTSLHGAVFINNTAVYGGGFFTDTPDACNTLGTAYAGNSASKSGGGFYCSQGGMNLSYAAFEDNVAPQGSSYTCAQNCQTYGSNVYNSVNGTVSGCNAISHEENALQSVLSIMAGGAP